jgi:hypothetical protein
LSTLSDSKEIHLEAYLRLVGRLPVCLEWFEHTAPGVISKRCRLCILCLFCGGSGISLVAAVSSRVYLASNSSASLQRLSHVPEALQPRERENELIPFLLVYWPPHFRLEVSRVFDSTLALGGATLSKRQRYCSLFIAEEAPVSPIASKRASRSHSIKLCISCF